MAPPRSQLRLLHELVLRTTAALSVLPRLMHDFAPEGGASTLARAQL